MAAISIQVECKVAKQNADGSEVHYVYPKKGVCDFCDGTNVRIRVEEETQVPDGAGGRRAAHICAACDG